MAQSLWFYYLKYLDLRRHRIHWILRTLIYIFRYVVTNIFKDKLVIIFLKYVNLHQLYIFRVVHCTVNTTAQQSGSQFTTCIFYVKVSSRQLFKFNLITVQKDATYSVYYISVGTNLVV